MRGSSVAIWPAPPREYPPWQPPPPRGAASHCDIRTRSSTTTAPPRMRQAHHCPRAFVHETQSDPGYAQAAPPATDTGHSCEPSPPHLPLPHPMRCHHKRCFKGPREGLPRSPRSPNSEAPRPQGCASGVLSVQHGADMQGRMKEGPQRPAFKSLLSDYRHLLNVPKSEEITAF